MIKARNFFSTSCTFFLTLSLLLVSPSISFAQNLEFNDNVTVNPVNAGYFISDLGILISRIAQVGLGIAGLIVFGYFIWGGSKWLLAGADKGKTEEAKAMITQAVIGFAVFASVFVVYALVTDFLGIRNKVNIEDITNPAGGTGGGGGGGGATASCTATTVNQSFNDGGAGGYCTGGGAATVKCVAAGVGGISYPHFEPCSCLSGTPSWNWAVCP